MEDLLLTIRRDGTQAAFLDRMQTRQELYDLLGYDGKVAAPIHTKAQGKGDA